MNRFVDHDFTFAEQFDISRVVLWLLLIPVAYFQGWMNSVAAVFLLSVYANIASDYAAFRGGDERKLRALEAKVDRLLEAVEAAPKSGPHS